MTRVIAHSRRHGATLLLAALFLGGGGKNPVFFCVWGLFALLWSIDVIQTRSPDRPSLAYFLIFAAGLFFSFLYSVDRSHSIYPACQIAVFAGLWLAVQTRTPFPDAEYFWQTLQVLGALTAIVTSLQWTAHTAVYGFLPINPTFNAAWMAALVAAFLSKRRPHRFETFLSLWLAALVIFGSSRSGLLALSVGTMYAARRRYPGSWALAGLSAAAIAALCVPHVWLVQRLNLLEQGGRLRILEIACRAFAERPLTGYGPGNFELAYMRYAFPVQGAVQYARTTEFAHNDFLQALSEWGWPAAASLFLGFLSVLTEKPSTQGLAAPAKAILLTLATAALFNPIFHMPALLCLAVLAASVLLRPAPRAVTGRVAQMGVISGMCAIGLLTLGCGMRAWWGSHHQWERVLRINPHDGEAWHELANESSDVKESVFFHRNAVLEAPFEPYYSEALARTLEGIPGNERLSEATENYLRALELAPTRAVNVLGVARLLWRAGQAKPALVWAQRARGIEPNYWEAAFWEARCLNALGRPAEALMVLKDLITRHAAFQKSTPVPPQSLYEASILNYEAPAVDQALARIRSHSGNGVQ